MTELLPSDKITPAETKRVRLIRVLIFWLEIVFVGGLLTLWLTSKEVRQNRSLWILFLYCFPSEFLVSFVPHEPVILFFSKYYGPMTVALVSMAGTMLAETLDYSAIRFIKELKFLAKARQRAIAEKLIRLFWKAPFLALWVAAFAPVPFYLFRFLVVMADYPLGKYLIVILTARLPKFYLLALLGKVLRIPDLWIAIFFAVLILSAYLPAARFYKKNKIKHS